MHDPPSGNGYARVGFPGLPIFVHWTSPALGTTAGLFAMAVAGSFNIPVFAWTSLAFVGLILIHELGHALAAWSLRIGVEDIVLAGTGGWCLISSAKPLTPFESLLIFGGGMLAQVALLGATVLGLVVLGAPSYLPLNCAVIVFIACNLVLLVVNVNPNRSKDAQMIRQAISDIRRHDA